MLPKQPEANVWKTFCKAVGAEYREHNSITGASGVEHAVEAIAVDEPGRRLIIISAEPSARIAAMMESDIQSTLPETKVIVARPIAFDFSNIASLIASTIKTPSLKLDNIGQWAGEFNRTESADQQKVLEQSFSMIAEPALNAMKNFSLPFLAQTISFIQQISSVDWTGIIDADKKSINIGAIVAQDSFAQDRRFGICSIPLYEMNADDWDMLSDPKNYGDFAERLKRMGIYQYFYPSPDSLALALVDRGLSDGTEIMNIVQRSEARGHPWENPRSQIYKTFLTYLMLSRMGAILRKANMGWRSQMQVAPKG